MTEEVIAEKNGQDKHDDGAEITELEHAIIRQVEYYFGDVNLQRDKFLRDQVGLDDGWVPLDVLIRFNRLAKLTLDTEAIAAALNKSTAGIVDVSEDNKKVRRNPELPVPEMNEERRKDLSNRTVYAKGFGKDTTLDDILKFFRQFDFVENVIMRKYLDRSSKKKLFKGSVFATFKTREQAEKFLATKDVKFEDKELLTLWQEAYVQQKQEEYANKKEQKDKKSKKKEKEAEAVKEEFKLPTGTVLHFTHGTETMKREDIKEAFTPLEFDVAYIDFKVGDTEGWVRFSKEGAAKEVMEKMTDGKLKIDGADVAFKLLEDDEEKAYLDRTVEEMAKRRKNMKNFKHHKGRNFKGKQNRKRRQDSNDDVPSKKAKQDS